MATQNVNPNAVPDPQPVEVPEAVPPAVGEAGPAAVPEAGLEAVPNQEPEVPDLEPKYKLARYIYLSSGEGIYISGCPFAHKYFVKTRLSFLDDLIDVKKQCSEIVEVIEKAAKATCLYEEPAVPRRSSLIFALAYCCRLKNPEMRCLCYKLLNICCTNIDELILFIKFCHDLNNQGWGEGMRKAVNKWYLSKEPMELAQILSSCKSRHGWSHKDILCLTRPNPEKIEYKLLMTYAVKGYKEYIAAVNNLEDEDVKTQILNSPVSKYLTEVAHFKVDQVVDSAIVKYKENNLTLGHIPQSLFQRDEFLMKLIPELQPKQLFKLLMQLHRKKFASKTKNPNTESLLKAIIQTVKTYLGNNGKINKLHCVDLLILKENYYQGCKPWKHPRKKLPQTPKKGEDSGKQNKGDTKLLQSLEKLINTTADLDTKTKKLRILLVMEYPKEDSNPMCFQNAHVPIKTAMATFFRYMNKRAYALTCGVFSDTNVLLVNIPRKRLLTEYENELKKADRSRHFTLMDAPMQWAKNNDKSIDVFINVIVNQRSIDHTTKKFNPKKAQAAAMPRGNRRGGGKKPHKPYIKMHPIDALIEYREGKKIDKAKLITISLGDIYLNVASARPTPGCIDIVGFDENVPRIIDSFINDHFE